MRAADNPFRTSVINHLPFRGASPEKLFEKWRHAGFRGAIVGPCGSGKTTLLGEILEAARACGLDPLHLVFTDEHAQVLCTSSPFGRDVPAHDRGFARAVAAAAENRFVFLDGLQLVPRLLPKLGGARGLLVTAHRETALPTLYRTQTSLELLKSLVGRISSAAISDERLMAMLIRHSGNIREVFLAFYDETSE